MSIVTFHSLFSQKYLQLQPKQKLKGAFTHRETTYYRALNYELLGSSSIACLTIRLPAYFHKFRQKMERKCSIFVRFIFYYNMIFLFRSHYFFFQTISTYWYENKQSNQHMSIITIYFYALFKFWVSTLVAKCLGRPSMIAQ